MLNRNCRICAFALAVLLIVSTFSLADEALLPSEDISSINDPAYYKIILSSTESLLNDGKHDDFATSHRQFLLTAIALDKQHDWNTDTGKRMQELFKVANHDKYFNSLKALLACQDLSNDQLEIICSLPSSDTTNILVHYGYSCSADLFMASSLLITDSGFPSHPAVINKCVASWLTLPKDIRNSFDKLLLEALKSRPRSSRNVIDGLTYLCLNAPTTIDQRQCFLLMDEIGKTGNYFSIDLAEKFLQAGQVAEAKSICMSIATVNPENCTLLDDVAKFLWQRCGDAEAAADLYRDAIATVPEPAVRYLRLCYLSFLVTSNKMNELITIGQGEDKLFAADACFVQGKYPEAVDTYTALLETQALPLATRLDAWGGLLIADPAKAYHSTEMLLDAIMRSPRPQRDDLVLWFAHEYWNAVDWAVPNSRTVTAWQQKIHPISEVVGWEELSRDLAHRLLIISPDVCLRPYATAHPPSLRVPIAVIFALAKKPKEAISVLRRPIAWEILPPVGGWKDDRGEVLPDPLSPHQYASPQENEFEKLAIEVLYRLPLRPSTKDANLLYATALMQDVLGRLQPLDAAIITQTRLKPFIAAFTDTVNSISPIASKSKDTVLPLQPEAVPEVFTTVETMVKAALKNDNVAMETPLLVNEGLLLALMKVRQPELLDRIFTLTLYSLDRYQTVKQNPIELFQIADSIAGSFASRRDVDTKAYVDRLRERYPRPTQK